MKEKAGCENAPGNPSCAMSISRRDFIRTAATGFAGAALAGCVRRLDGDAETRMGRHEYKPPFDKNRYGKPYPQPRPPFVWLSTQDRRCRILSLFCVFGPAEPVQQWTRPGDAWTIETSEGAVQVRTDSERLVVHNAANGRAWELRLDGRR